MNAVRLTMIIKNAKAIYPLSLNEKDMITNEKLQKKEEEEQTHIHTHIYIYSHSIEKRCMRHYTPYLPSYRTSLASEGTW